LGLLGWIRKSRTASCAGLFSFIILTTSQK
jgi:hypothetical protein